MIATALGFPPDDEVRSLWKALGLQRVGHRGSLLVPRPVDDEFRALWNDVQILLLRLGRQFEPLFTASLPLFDELAGKEQPDGGDLKRLRGSMPHSVVALDRFFERAGPTDLVIAVRSAPATVSVPSPAWRRPGGRLGVRHPEEWERGRQILVWSDGLGSGLPVDHEDHAGGEDVVGHDPAVGVVGRHGAVVMKDVGQQGAGCSSGFVR